MIFLQKSPTSARKMLHSNLVVVPAAPFVSTKTRAPESLEGVLAVLSGCTHERSSRMPLLWKARGPQTTRPQVGFQSPRFDGSRTFFRFQPHPELVPRFLRAKNPATTRGKKSGGLELLRVSRRSGEPPSGLTRTSLDDGKACVEAGRRPIRRKARPALCVGRNLSSQR